MNNKLKKYLEQRLLDNRDKFFSEMASFLTELSEMLKFSNNLDEFSEEISEIILKLQEEDEERLFQEFLDETFDESFNGIDLNKKEDSIFVPSDKEELNIFLGKLERNESLEEYKIKNKK